jgi:hypothetical protein
MVNEQQAIKSAMEYLVSVYAPYPLEGLALEEIEMDQSGQWWLVTLGFWEHKPRSLLDKALAEATVGVVLKVPSAEVSRVYKVVKVAAASGKAVSMKMREG